MMEVTPSFLHRALERMKREIFESLHVAMPGIIQKWNPETATADIRPTLARQTMTGKIVEAPLLRDVPVLRPNPEAAVSVGDRVLLIFADFCMDAALTSDSPILPPLARMHDLSDAVAITGFMKGGAA